MFQRKLVSEGISQYSMSDPTTANRVNLTSFLLQIQTPDDFSLETGRRPICLKARPPKLLRPHLIYFLLLLRWGLTAPSTITSLLLCLASSLKEQAVIIVSGLLDWDRKGENVKNRLKPEVALVAKISPLVKLVTLLFGRNWRKKGKRILKEGLSGLWGFENVEMVTTGRNNLVKFLRNHRLTLESFLSWKWRWQVGLAGNKLVALTLSQT